MKSQSEQRILSDPIARLLSTPLAPAECIVSLHRVHCQSAPGAPPHRRQYNRRTRVDDPLHLRLHRAPKPTRILPQWARRQIAHLWSLRGTPRVLAEAAGRRGSRRHHRRQYLVLIASGPITIWNIV